MKWNKIKRNVQIETKNSQPVYLFEICSNLLISFGNDTFFYIFSFCFWFCLERSKRLLMSVFLRYLNVLSYSITYFFFRWKKSDYPSYHHKIVKTYDPKDHIIRSKYSHLIPFFCALSIYLREAHAHVRTFMAVFY